MIQYTEKQSDDFLTTHIDVSPFFNMDDIIVKKCKYFANSDIVKQSKKFIDMIRSITSDNTLNHQISSMYNHNKRRMMICLVRAISRDYDKVTKYGDLLDKSMAIGHCETKKAYKNGARSIIIRMLLDLIQCNTGENCDPDEKGYFSRIRAIHFNNLGFGFARKILIYLRNKAPFDTINEKYIGFYTLIRDVFESPCHHGIQNNAINYISEILQVLSDGDLERTNWCPLVVLKFNHTDVEAAIENELINQYEAKSDVDGYGIRITDAGRSFVKFCTNFEYYACRYVPQISSLFFLDNSKQIIELINNIKNDAMRCITNIIETDENHLRCQKDHEDHINYEAQFSNNDVARYVLLHLNGKEQTHIAGIINKHIGYLNNYRLFLINESIANKDKIMNNLLHTISEYIKKFEEVNNKNSEICGIKHYYFGNQYKEMYDGIIKQYNCQLKEAFKNPYNKNTHITGIKTSH